MRLIASSLILSAFALPAQAFFVGDKTRPTPPEPVSLTGYTVVADRTLLPLNQVGTADPTVAGLPAGYNAGVPMDYAFKLALPEGWRAAIAQNVARQKAVSWGNGLTWLEAVEQMANQTNTAATVYWAQKTVIVRVMPDESSLAVPVMQASASDVNVEVYDAAGYRQSDYKRATLYSSPGAVDVSTASYTSASASDAVTVSDVPPASKPTYASYAVVQSSPGAFIAAPALREEMAPAPREEMAAASIEAVERRGLAPVESSPGAVVPANAAAMEASPAPAREVSYMPAPRSDSAAPAAEPAKSIEMASIDEGATDSSVMEVASAEPAVVAPTKAGYTDLGDFLREDVKVDRTGLTLVETISALIPRNWSVDVRDDKSYLENLRLDLTYVGPRGAALNAIGTKENLVLIPYLEFRKVVVSRGQTN